MGKASTIRDGVYDKIETDLAASSYTINDCNLEKTYFPQENLEGLTKPYIKVVAMPPGTERNRELRNTDVVLLSISVQVAVQQKVDHTNTSYIDKLVDLVEEIMDALEDDDLVSNQDYSWSNTDPLRDENGLIYSYEQLSVLGIFNSVFNITYQHIKQ